jgi:hypothetical protein
MLELIIAITTTILVALTAIVGYMLKEKSKTIEDSIKESEKVSKASRDSLDVKFETFGTNLSGLRSEIQTHIAMQSERNAVVASNIQVLFEKINDQYKLIRDIETKITTITTMLDHKDQKGGQ